MDDDKSALLQVPPHNPDMERAVIGEILLAPNRLGEVMRLLEPDAFYTPFGRAAFTAMVAIMVEGGSVDAVSVGDRVSAGGEIGNAAISEWLTGCIELVPSGANVLYHAKVVASDWNRRRIIGACDELRKQAVRRDTDLRSDTLGYVDTVLRVVAERGRQDTESIADVIVRVSADVDKRVTNITESLLPWTYTDLDRYAGGIEWPYNVVIGARSSVGKTTLCANLSLRWAKLGHAVGFFSLEMDADQIGRKLACIEGRVNGLRLRQGQANDEELKHFLAAMNTVSQLPIYLSHCPGMTCLEMASQIERQVNRHGVEIAIIDYVQLVGQTSQRHNDQERVQEAMRIFQANGKRLRVPHIITSQLRRDAVHTDREPRMSDLRDSGAVEHAADIILLLHREKEAERAFMEHNDHKVSIVVAKSREGSVGRTGLWFRTAVQRFENYQES